MQGSIKGPISVPLSPSNAVKCYPCREVPLNYNRSLLFHGGDTGSTPVRDAIFLSTQDSSEYPASSWEGAEETHVVRLLVRVGHQVSSFSKRRVQYSLQLSFSWIPEEQRNKYEREK